MPPRKYPSYHRRNRNKTVFAKLSPLNMRFRMNFDRERNDSMKILVTGGAGYIGTHTCVELLQSGYDIAVIDNLCNSKKGDSPCRSNLRKEIPFLRSGSSAIRRRSIPFSLRKIDAVIHFAGLKAVGESVRLPLRYYENNLASTLTLLTCMKAMAYITWFSVLPLLSMEIPPPSRSGRLPAFYHQSLTGPLS